MKCFAMTEPSPVCEDPCTCTWLKYAKRPRWIVTARVHSLAFKNFFSIKIRDSFNTTVINWLSATQK